MVNKPAPPPVPAPSAVVLAFVGILQALGQTVVASHERGVKGPVMVAIWGRIMRMAQRFAAIAAHVAADTLRPPRLRPADPDRATSSREPTYPRVKLAGGIGWLCSYVPEARNYGRYVRMLMTDPEMAALLEAAPQLGGILRSLCRMLKVEPMPALLARPAGPRGAGRQVSEAGTPFRAQDGPSPISRCGSDAALSPEPRSRGRPRGWHALVAPPVPERR